MADHGEVQYATAEGNDLPAHEAGFSQFVQVTFIGTALVVNILIGLAIGGAIGHWLPAASGSAVLVAYRTPVDRQAFFLAHRGAARQRHGRYQAGCCESR